jgi:hypothetical protein
MNGATPARERGGDESGPRGEGENGPAEDRPPGGSRICLPALAALLRAQGGLIAGLLADDAISPHGPEEWGNGPSPAQIAAGGPRIPAGDAAEYELLIDTIYEGYLLHYGPPRLLAVPEADLGLLAGDHLYALGLARLVALGDLVAVAELADVITLTALAHGAGEAGLARAVWDAGAHAVGWGPSEAHERAKGLARAAAPQALGAMRELSLGARSASA